MANNKYGKFNPQVKIQKEFKDKVEEYLEKNKGEWVKTPDIQANITSGKWKGYGDWSPEWTRNLLYSIKDYLKDTRTDFEAEKRAGPGQDHWYWRIKNG